jgi:hypothetical protein
MSISPIITAQLENCAMIFLSGLRAHRSWRDVPCAMDQVQHFICKKPSESRSHSDFLTAVKLTPRLNATCPHATFTCASGECISEKNVCDQEPDCFDASDERNCELKYPLQQSIALF